MTDLKDGEVYQINFRNFSGDRDYIQERLSDKLIDKYIKHVDLIGQKNETGIEKLQQNIEHQKEKIEKLGTTTLKDLIDKYDIIDQLPDDIMKNDLLVFLLRRGYIDEQYANYINYFKNTSITMKIKTLFYQ